MTTLTLRRVKGSPLTHDELDDNFLALDSSISNLEIDSGLTIAGGDLDISEGDLILRNGDFKYNPRLAFHDLSAGLDRVIYDSSGAVLIGTDYNGLTSHMRVSRTGNQLVEMGCKTSNSGQHVFVQLGNAGSANGRSSGIKSTQTSSDFESWKLSLVAYNSTDGFIDAIDVNPDGTVDVNSKITFQDSATFNEGINVIGDVNISGGELLIDGAAPTTGTVTSVDVAGPAGFTSSGGPVTSSGTVTLGYAGTHSLGLPNNTKQGQWDTAYGWGDHSTAGYIGDAASNGNIYGRQNNSWVVIPSATSYTAGNGLNLNVTEFEMSGSYTGTFTATGDVVAYSDIALKENVNPITNALEKVTQLTGITFNRIGEERASTGLSAQDVQSVLPEAVHENDGILGVAYGNVVGLLVEAIKELKEEINQLKG